MVSRHEIGGKHGADILRDADSIAFFEYNIDFYLKDNGLKKTETKIKFMFGRLSPELKKIVKNLHYKNLQIKKMILQS